MSKILELAKTFEQNSQNEAASIEQQMKADLNVLRININAELWQSEQKIIADIRAQQLRMSKAIFKPYLWGLVGILVTCLIIIAGFFIAVSNANNKLDDANNKLGDLNQQIVEKERTLNLLNTKTKGLRLEKCPVENSKETRVCVATDPNSPPYYSGNDKTKEWRYIAQINSR